ncbi:MAG: cytochrome P450 [Polyangiaceae bacterium]
MKRRNKTLLARVGDGGWLCVVALGFGSVSCASGQSGCHGEKWSGSCQLIQVTKVRQSEFPLPSVTLEAIYRPQPGAEGPTLVPADQRQEFATLSRYEDALRAHLESNKTVRCYINPPPPGQCQPGPLNVEVPAFDAEHATATPGPAGPKGCAQIDATGSQDRVRQAKTSQAQISERFEFADQASELAAADAAALDAIAARLKQAPNLQCVGVVGAWIRGESVAIAFARARAVRDQLVARGIEAERLLALTVDPPVQNAGSGAEPPNPKDRRVTLSVLLESPALAVAMSFALSVPGPNPTPILGRSGNLLQFAIDPVRYVGTLFERYGRIAVLVRGSTRLVSIERGVPATVFLYGPELNRALLTGHDEFHKSALSGPLYPQEPINERRQPLTRLLTGLFHVNGDAHRQHRRLLMPAFHKSRIETYRNDMVEIAESVLSGYRHDTVRDICPDMMELTLRVATKTLFGADLGEAGVRVGRALHDWLNLFRLSAALPWDGPFIPYRRWLNVSRSIDAQLVDILAQRRKTGFSGSDMLSMLMEARDENGGQLSEDELIGHAGVIFAAGHETSSHALSWTMLLLSQHPRILSDLYDELDGVLHGDAPRVDQLASLPLLERVVKESLRILPPVPFNHRVVGVETELGGHRLPRNTEVITSIYHTQRMPDLFENPTHFLPGRWAGLDPGPYAYNPFGTGPRMCIGATFALMEIKIVLALLVQRFRFELAPGSKVNRFLSITMAPRPGLKMRILRQDRAFSKTSCNVHGNVREMVAFPENSIELNSC